MKNILELIEENSKDIERVLSGSEVIMEEINNDMIEWQTACYMEDLVLEQMMYEDFNEEKIETLIEGTLKERLVKGVLKIKDFIDNFLAFIGNLIDKISEKINLSKAFINKYGRQNIEDAMANCKVKVKMLPIKPANTSGKVVDGMIDDVWDLVLGDNPTGLDKANVLRILEVKSLEEIEQKIKYSYIEKDEPEEQYIANLDAKTIIGWLEAKSLATRLNDLAQIKRELKSIKLSYTYNNDKNKREEVNKDVVFLLNVVRKILLTSTKYELKVTGMCRAIILRAISGKNENRVKPTKNDEDEYWKA